MKRTTLLVSLLLILSGCSTHPTRGNWGEGATLTPGWSKIKKAAYGAATDPKTWVPALGAAVFAIDDWDEEVSEWAADEQPIFGNDASDWSDDLRTVTTVAWLTTAFAASSGENGGDWAWNKTKGISVQLATIGISDSIVFGLKDVTDRERPDGSDNDSFPSAHASMASTRAALASRNLEYIDMSEGARTALDIGFYSAGLGTAWARVEAEKHYPSDVLAGVAIGNFLATFINDAFLDPGRFDRPVVSVQPLPGGGMMTVQIPLQ
jgi:membrane-associated phospholipid phosphatase